MNAFAGTGTLIRFILRRDRVRLPIWIGALALLIVGGVQIFPDTYPTEASRQARAELISNPAMRVMAGPGFGLDDYTFGAMVNNEYTPMMGIFTGLMSILLVVRHTRAEEETGRVELIRAAMVGRYATMTAALAVVSGAHLVLALILGFGLSGSLDEFPLGSSMLFGLAVGMMGIVYAGVAAVAVHFSEHGRTATGLALAVLGVTYVLRAIGDIQENALTWLSPVGWALQTRVYVDERWWPLLIGFVVSIVLVVIAFALGQRRDVGGALLPPRQGPSHAADRLLSPFGLATRLQRGVALAWTTGIVLFALFIGGIGETAADFFDDNPAAQQYAAFTGSDSPIDLVFGIYISFLAILAGFYGVSAMNQLRGEESAGRAENMLSTAVSRDRWSLSFLGFALLTSTMILLLSGMAMGLVHSLQSGTWNRFLELTGAALVYTPAVWLSVGVSLAVFGWLPRWSWAAWLVPTYSFLIVMFGPLLGLPGWTFEAAAFDQVPTLPGVAMSWTPVIVLMLLALVAMAAGVIGFRQRDLDTSA